MGEQIPCYHVIPARLVTPAAHVVIRALTFTSVRGECCPAVSGKIRTAMFSRI